MKAMQKHNAHRAADRDLPKGRRNPAYTWMIRELRVDPESFRDSAGEVQATWLAEAYVDAGTDDRHAWLDDPDHWVWGAAVLACDFVAAPGGLDSEGVD